MIQIINDIEKKIINVIDFQLVIKVDNKNIKNNNVKKVLKYLYLIYKEKNYIYIHTDFYLELQNKIK